MKSKKIRSGAESSKSKGGPKDGKREKTCSEIPKREI